jgi:hypothetical protein
MDTNIQFFLSFVLLNFQKVYRHIEDIEVAEKKTEKTSFPSNRVQEREREREYRADCKSNINEIVIPSELGQDHSCWSVFRQQASDKAHRISHCRDEESGVGTTEVHHAAGIHSLLQTSVCEKKKHISMMRFD